jgi:hypothetical protein
MSCPAILVAETRPGVHDPASVSGKPYVAAATNLFSLLNNVFSGNMLPFDIQLSAVLDMGSGRFSEICESEAAY